MSKLRKQIGEFYKDEAAKEDSLREVVTNINATDESSKLLHSIRSKKSGKISRFSAKVNENGEVSIDETMIDNDVETTENVNNPDGVPLVSYAKVKASGPGGNSAEGKSMLGAIKGNTNREKFKSQVRAPLISVVETTNRFHLLDEDGHVIEDTNEGMEGFNHAMNNNQELNSGWIKKEERNLNAHYTKRVSKEQRFEAKRYVLDRLVPLEVDLSRWAIAQHEYLRSLCSLYNFWEGYLAVSSDTYLGIGNKNRSAHVIEVSANDGNEEDMEEVEFETDGSAISMKADPTQMPAATDAIMHESGSLYQSIGSEGKSVDVINGA
ncbi:hypothetical protein L1987_83416 [Smallanthus sonchifolius]|uniref:Uncharacterized protein n=1 Tax=Smallanthus sonchifolius TaxID=185202 RepID=A0ACB8YGB0_9ASTR|nr:hypothetical protein L1987_83416 [Smallanthus sonchifolius]